MKDQDYQIFEAYLSGDLPEAELKTHQERLGTDQDYKESFELFQSLNKHLADKFKNEHELDQFKDSVSNVSNEYFESKSKSQFPWIKMAIAACLIVAIGLYFYLGDISKPQYDEIAQIPSIHLTVRSSDNQIYTQAEDAFNEKQYAEAIALFDQILEQESEAQSIKLYQGISYMEMDSIDNARKLFDEIISKENSYAEEALWYGALNELKAENYSACKGYLSKIESSTSRHEDAKNLLKKLD